MKKFFLFGGRVSVKVINQLLNIVVTLLFFLMLFYGTYSIWDNQQTLSAAQAENFATYKPVKEDQISFSALQAKNSDVFGWLTVYGTKIDYPLVQGADNKRYLNTNAEGNYQMSGSLFLDYRNQKDFSDFNSLIFGHHMAESAMFGDLDKFNEEKFFNEHLYGNLYYNGTNHGIKFFAFINANAFDATLYQAALTNPSSQTAYLAHLKETAAFYRDLNVTNQDHLVLLSTCTADYTNGRHVLVGIVTQQEIAIPQALQKTQIRSNKKFLVQAVDWLGSTRYGQKTSYLLFILLFLLLFIWYSWLVVKRKQREGREL